MTDKEIHNLIQLGEGIELEFKQSMPSDLGREICAMANSIGGRILLGVDDTGRIIGIKQSNRLKSEIQNIARNLVPPIVLQLIFRFTCSVTGLKLQTREVLLRA